MTLMDIATEAMLKAKLQQVKQGASIAKGLATSGPQVVTPPTPVVLANYQNSIRMLAEQVEELTVLVGLAAGIKMP